MSILSSGMDNALHATAYVPEDIRNRGASLGLAYPYLVGKYDGRWTVWHRHTGEIVFVSRHENPILAEREADIQCHERNGIKRGALDAETRNAIDDTP